MSGERGAGHGEEDAEVEPGTEWITPGAPGAAAGEAACGYWALVPAGGAEAGCDSAPSSDAV